MSLVPIFFRDWWDDGWWPSPFGRTSRLFDQHFGSGIFSDDQFRAMTSCHPQDLRRLGFARPWANCSHFGHWNNGISTASDCEKFQINLDVQQFSPNEITVKTTDNNLIVEGKHEEKQDEHSFVSRHFVRRYVLPAGHDVKDVISCLSSDGILTITAPKKALPPSSTGSIVNERTIPVTQTGENEK
ncbi:protein lethal(2)essential for life-like [Wyeomyia smithii]|uniref:protein lethal(2)essential for life-like n=1 Tax=Wyeomyia smithii TaxID=174621 RepID=UPI002467F3FA|nr:protein lethal(2)essential for life-like [Wyeomyia smithii]